jgi:GT2 family glycosyltransferase
MPCFNAADTIGDQLAALATQTYEGEWELIVADNRSTDGSREAIEVWRDRLPNLRVVEAPDKASMTYALNEALGASKGKLILTCDADDAAEPGWIAALVAAAINFDLVGGICDPAKLNDPKVQGWRIAFPRDGLPRLFNDKSFAVGCNTGVWRDVLEGVGGWDETFRFAGNDVELCLRAQFAGYSLGFAPEAVMNYRYRTDLRSTVRQFFRYGSSEPRLLKMYASSGLRRPSILRSVGRWCWLLVTLPAIPFSGRLRGRWMMMLAYRLGRIAGSVRCRTLAV